MCFLGQVLKHIHKIEFITNIVQILDSVTSFVRKYFFWPNPRPPTMFCFENVQFTPFQSHTRTLTNSISSSFEHGLTSAP